MAKDSQPDAWIEVRGLRRVDVPPRWRSHSLVHRQYFYTIPAELLESVEREVGSVRFDPAMWQLEQELSAVHGDHRSSVGFGPSAPVALAFLREPQLNAQAIEHIRETSEVEDVEGTVEQLRSRLGQSTRNLRAYAGWLLTNVQFLEEHSQLMRQLATPNGPIPIPEPGPQGIARGVAEGWFGIEDGQDQVALAQAFAAFCGRWRLVKMCGPLLPLPIGSQVPAPLPLMSAQQAMASGYCLIAIPDTMPLPSEGEFRAMVESAICANPQEHLAEWRQIIWTGSDVKRSLTRYARVSEVQHFCRLLLSRHPEALHRKMSALREALASYLGVSEDSVKDDLQLIEGRLRCSDWYIRYPVHRF